MHDVQTEVFLWFDVCTINEHQPERVSKGFSDTFMEAVGSIGHTLLVLTPWDQPLVLSRSWCMWEMYYPEQKRCELTICLTNEQRQAFLGAGDLQDAFAGIDSSKASAGSDIDRQKIAEAVKASVGFKALDGMIFARLRDWALGAKQAAEAEARSAAGGALTTEKAVLTAAATAEQLSAQGRLEEEAALWLEVIAFHEPLEGPTGEGTLRAKGSYASVLMTQGKLEEAERLYREVLMGCAAAVQANVNKDINLETLIKSAGNYAILLEKQGRLDEAERVYRDVVEMKTEAFGANHAETLSSKGGYADILRLQGKQDEAERLYQEVIEAKTATLGANHADTLREKGNYAIVLENQGNMEEAERVYWEVIEGHTTTLTFKYNLGAVLANAGDFARALPLFEEAAMGRAAALGEDHQSTQSARRACAQCDARPAQDKAKTATLSALGGKGIHATELDEEGKLEEA